MNFRIFPSALSPLWIGWLLVFGTAQGADRAQTFQSQVQPLLKKYCWDCHNAADAEADLNLQPFQTRQSVLEGRKVFLKVLAKLQAEEMPPEDVGQPTAAERKTLVEWFDDAMNNIDCSGPLDPGRVTIRRLNRIEYRHTIRDLLGVDYQPADDFPADDVGYGFDNIGDVLSLPTLLRRAPIAVL